MGLQLLTEDGVARLAPRTATDYTDAGQAGLTLRVTAGGAIKTWTFVYRYAGARKRLNLGRHPAVKLAEARTAARAYAVELDNGRNPAPVAGRAGRASLAAAVTGRTFADLVTLFEGDRKGGAANREATRVENARMFRSDLLPALGDRVVATITRRDVRALHELKSASAPVQADRLVKLASRVFNYGIDRDEEWLAANPAARIPLNGTGEGERVLTAAEIGIVVAALSAPIVPATSSPRIVREARRRQAMHDAFLFLLLVGQRPFHEVARAKWDEVDLDGARWTIPGARTKNKLAHSVPLSPIAVALLARIRATRPARIPATAPFVFSTTDGLTSIASRAKKFCSAILVPALSRAFVDDVRPFSAHDFRRTVATNLGALKVAEETIARVLNHKQGQDRSVTAKHYNLYRYDDEKRAALVAWEDRIRVLVAAHGRVGVWRIGKTATLDAGGAVPALPPASAA